MFAKINAPAVKTQHIAVFDVIALFEYPFCMLRSAIFVA